MIIVRAAIMFSNGEVLEGRDYGHILWLAQLLNYPLGSKKEGFMTSSGDFVLPKKASSIAVKAGQIETTVNKLLPEDLWPETARDY